MSQANGWKIENKIILNELYINNSSIAVTMDMNWSDKG